MYPPDLYERVSRFAALCHGDQKYPGQNLPYLLHLSQVFMEVIAAHTQQNDFDLELAGTCALLHDTLEDTAAEYDDLATSFGAEVADGVLALSKNKELEKNEQMDDSLERILKQPKEVAIVKMADRSANLQAPPTYWTHEKRTSYCEEAKKISKKLGYSNSYMSERLDKRIDIYEKNIHE